MLLVTEAVLIGVINKMIDIKFLRENPDAVRENIKKKFQDKKPRARPTASVPGEISSPNRSVS